MMHKLLSRQMKKCDLTEECLPSELQWKKFLSRINQTYLENDQERYLLERSLTISSKEMKEIYEQLQDSETRYALAAKGANDGLWDWDLVNGGIYYSERWMEILGISADDPQLNSKNCWIDRIHPSDYATVINQLSEHLSGETEHFKNEHRILHSDGEYRWVLIRGLAVRDEENKAVRIAGSLTDVSERKLAEEKLAHDALHDSLTGLPNRKRFLDRLSRSLERMSLSDYRFAVLFIDLDRFKLINDTMGHQTGDEVLLNVTERLEVLFRPSDMVARLGGDEFVVLVENVGTIEQLFSIVQRVLQKLQIPITVDQKTLYISASIGVVMSNPDYKRAEDLVRDADLAMYRAKAKGKARFELFEPKMHAGALSLLQLEIDLRQAIERREFELHYQPIILLASEEIVGFEALIRWNHPVRGFVAPNDFIPIAEKTGLILPIGRWVLKEACQQLRKWQKTYPEAENLVMNINISAYELEQSDLLTVVQDVLKETGLSPRCLKLEITETVIMKNAEQAIKTVKELQKLGVRVSIDDFGTGYSSLSYLHRLPIDTLKVDRSFINRIGLDCEHSEIIQTIIQLAYSLGIDVVAEGVETEKQLNFLKNMSCDYAQGFYYSRPVNTSSATKMIEEMNKELFAEDLTLVTTV